MHRDLKPGNIMLTKSGSKLLDFGLAKPRTVMASAADSSGPPPSFTAAPTLDSPSPPVSPLTTQGAMFGTIQYMSPEQIEGKGADARSDIFAFGAVLYEMASGKQAFQGKSQLKVASAILEDEPVPLISIQANTPAVFQRLVAACLAKDPDQRIQCARDLRLQLEWVLAGAGEASAAVVGLSRDKVSARSLLLGAGAGMVLFALALLFFYWQRLPQPTAFETQILPPEKSNFTLATDDASGPVVLSPDGQAIASEARLNWPS